MVTRLSTRSFLEFPYMGNGMSIVELSSVREKVLSVVVPNGCFRWTLFGADSLAKHSLEESIDCQ